MEIPICPIRWVEWRLLLVGLGGCVETSICQIRWVRGDSYLSY